MQMMQVWDADSDGVVDYREFIAATMSLYQASRGVLPTERLMWLNRLRIVFNEIDTNKNGMLSPDELEKLVRDKKEVQRVLTVRSCCCHAQLLRCTNGCFETNVSCKATFPCSYAVIMSPLF
jgi:hypothetical protein